MNKQGMTLGQLITSLREKKGLSQKDVVEYVGVTEAAASRWEADKAEPRLKARRKLAELFGVSLDMLVDTKRAPLISEVLLQRPSAVSWFRNRKAHGCTLTLVIKSCRYNVMLVSRTEPYDSIEVVTGVFESEDVVPLLKDGTIQGVIEPSASQFDQLRSMQLGGAELLELIDTAEGFDAQKSYLGLSDELGAPRNMNEIHLLEDWRHLTEAQQKSFKVLIEHQLYPEEFDEEEFKRLEASLEDSSETTEEQG